MSSSNPDSGVSAAGLLSMDQLNQKDLWRDFIRWMRIHGNLDPDYLEQDIQAQLKLSRLSSHGSALNALPQKNIFSRAMVLLAIFDAALSSPRARQSLQRLFIQIQQRFPESSLDLCNCVDKEVMERFKDTVKELIEIDGFRRKPNVVIDTFRPRLIGTRPFDAVAGQRLNFRAVESENLGAPLYKETVSASTRAFATAVQMRSELESLPNNDDDLIYEQSSRAKMQNEVMVGEMRRQSVAYLDV